MKILASNWNNVLTDVLAELEKRGHTILPFDGKPSTLKKADVVVVWNETALAGWRDWIKKVQKMGKRVILVQHGRRGTSRIYPPFNEELISDLICVWGENDKKRLMSVGVPEKKIVITGTPLFKHLVPRTPHGIKNVVFSPEHWDKDVIENFIVADELKKLKGVNLISKILKGYQNEADYPNPISSDRNSPEHMRAVANVLSYADVVVSISESTFELMAESMDLPVIIADIWIPKACDGDDRYKEYHREYSDACTRVPLGRLNSTVMQFLKYPGNLRVERGAIAKLDGGIHIPNPLERIINVIEHGNNN